MSEANLIAIESFFRSRCNHKRILELDALILRKDLGDAHESSIQAFVQSAIEGVMKDERKV